MKKQQSGCLFTPRSQTFSSATTDRVPAVSFNCFNNKQKNCFLNSKFLTFYLIGLLFDDFIQS